MSTVSLADWTHWILHALRAELTIVGGNLDIYIGQNIQGEYFHETKSWQVFILRRVNLGLRPEVSFRYCMSRFFGPINYVSKSLSLFAFMLPNKKDLACSQKEMSQKKKRKERKYKEEPDQCLSTSFFCPVSCSYFKIQIWSCKEKHDLCACLPAYLIGVTTTHTYILVYCNKAHMQNSGELRTL